MALPELEPELLETETAEEDVEEKGEEVSPSAYRMFLLEEKARYLQKKLVAQNMMEMLEAALADPNLIVICYESEEDLQMFTVEKGRMGFGQKGGEYPEVPDGATRVTVARYRKSILTEINGCQGKINEIENLLDELEEVMGDPELIVRCVRYPDGANILVQEKGPIGFLKAS